jgi:hypothetical protein
MSRCFPFSVLIAAFVEGMSEQLRRGRQTHLKTTTGAEAAISLALASAIAMDSGLEEAEDEAIPITPRGAVYLYSRRGATGQAAGFRPSW